MDIDSNTLEWILALGESWTGVFIFFIWLQSQQRNQNATKMENAAMPVLNSFFKRLFSKIDKIIRLLEDNRDNRENDTEE